VSRPVTAKSAPAQPWLVDQTARATPNGAASKTCSLESCARNPFLRHGPVNFRASNRSGFGSFVGQADAPPHAAASRHPSRYAGLFGALDEQARAGTGAEATTVQAGNSARSKASRWCSRSLSSW
jgi:hypothetical protein